MNKSYNQALKAIAASLIADGKDAQVNTDHKCVDVFENGKIIEQHYPARLPDTVRTRGKFIYVGMGNGDYVCTKIKYPRKNYTDKQHKIKTVSDVLISDSLQLSEYITEAIELAEE